MHFKRMSECPRRTLRCKFGVMQEMPDAASLNTKKAQQGGIQTRQSKRNNDTFYLKVEENYFNK